MNDPVGMISTNLRFVCHVVLSESICRNSTLVVHVFGYILGALLSICFFYPVSTCLLVSFSRIIINDVHFALQIVPLVQIAISAGIECVHLGLVGVCAEMILLCRNDIRVVDRMLFATVNLLMCLKLQMMHFDDIDCRAVTWQTTSPATWIATKHRLFVVTMRNGGN